MFDVATAAAFTLPRRTWLRLRRGGATPEHFACIPQQRKDAIGTVLAAPMAF